MRYKNLDAQEAQKSFRREKYIELANAVFVTEINVKHLELLSCDEDTAGRYARELGLYQDQLASYIQKREKLGKMISGRAEADKDVILRRRDWLRGHLSELERNHMIQKELADNPDLYDGTQGFEGAEQHRRSVHEIEVRHQVATEALEYVGPAAKRVDEERSSEAPVSELHAKGNGNKKTHGNVSGRAR